METGFFWLINLNFPKYHALPFIYKGRIRYFTPIVEFNSTIDKQMYTV